jgi:hypothetical protein
MNIFNAMIIVCWLAIALAAYGNESKGVDMFVDSIKNLTQTTNADDEEQALGELLTLARQTNINYGYRVFSVTKNRRVMPDELDGVLEDELIVTIFVGEEAPYQEFEWRPKYSGHITRLVMP